MTDTLIVIAIVLSVISLVVNIITMNKKNSNNINDNINNKLLDLTSEINQQQSLIRQELNQTIQENIKNLGEMLLANQRISSENQTLSMEKLDKNINEKFQIFYNNNDKVLKDIKDDMENNMKSSSADNINKLNIIKKNIDDTFNNIQGQINLHFSSQKDIMENLENHIKEKQDNIQKTLTASLDSVESRLKTFSIESEQKLENIRGTVAGKLSDIQEDTNKNLDKMRDIVEEKMQKTLEDKMSQSFNIVSERLQQVYKGLGEMQNLAVNVGDLKKVLTNVKSRGIVGEIQLEAILEEILSPQQFVKNVETKKGSKKIVEYAVKLPNDNENIVYLPIDSKFPGDTYSKLRDAYDTGDNELINECAKNLIATLKSEAKDIRDKYIDPPNTTEFAIMFLPFEGLYCEAVNRGMVEILQKEYKVNIAGPSTMASLLNSLQMGFKTLAVQKRSSEVWKILSAVKTEFDNFEKILATTQKNLMNANDNLDKLITTRTRAIQRKLKDVTELADSDEAIRLIETI